MTDNKPTFRNPNVLQVLPFREYIRDNLPTGKKGLVVEDLDLVIRWYGKSFGQDAQGRFMLCELKVGEKNFLGTAQERTFGLLDKLLRLADPDAIRYAGFFLIRTTLSDWRDPSCRFMIGSTKLDHDGLNLFLLGVLPIPPYPVRMKV